MLLYLGSTEEDGGEWAQDVQEDGGSAGRDLPMLNAYLSVPKLIKIFPLIGLLQVRTRTTVYSND